MSAKKRVRLADPRPSKKTYLPKPITAGAWWVRRVEDETGKVEDLKAWVIPAKIEGQLLAKIEGRTEPHSDVSFWVALGFSKWRRRTLVTQPAAMWAAFAREAMKRIGKKGGSAAGADPVETIAAEIVAGGDAAAFLKSVRRGRGTKRQNLRYRLLREVEKLAGDTVPRRREDANTPDALALREPLVLELALL